MGSFRRRRAFDPLDLEMIDQSQRVRQPGIVRRMKRGRLRYASVFSHSLATAGLISTLCWTEYLRAYRSRLGHPRQNYV
jgi:hypothetical protein